MRPKNRWLATLLGVLAVFVLLIGALSFFFRPSTSHCPADAICLPGTNPNTLDPHLASDSTSAEYIVELFSGLVTISPKLELQLDLAKSVDVSPDGKTYTFVLRDNATFQDGRKVTADDVKWSLERAASKTLSSPTAMSYLGDIVGMPEYFQGKAQGIVGIEVVDPATIRFRIDAPKPYFLAKLSYPTAFVVDRKQVEAEPKTWTRKPNGTGPYQLTEFTLGERLVLTSYDNFYLGKPKLKQAMYLISGGSALTRFESNELDIAPVSPADIDRARDPSQPLSKLYHQSNVLSIGYMAFNAKQPPFDDPAVRRAIGMSIDRKKITEVTYKAMIMPATGILMPGLPGFTPDEKTLPFNPEAAKAELAKSKYAGKMPTITLTEIGGGAAASPATEAYLEQWKNILGITVEVKQLDSATFFADQQAGKLQMFTAGWIMDYPDPEDLLDLKFNSQSPLNDIGYANPEVDKLLNQARTDLDANHRLDLYRQAEKLLIADAAVVPLYFDLSHQVVSTALTGWFDPPMVVPRLRFVEVNR